MVPAKVCVIPQEVYTKIRYQNYVFYIFKLTEKHQSIGLILLFAYHTAQMQSSAQFVVPHLLKRNSEMLASLRRIIPIRSGESFTLAYKVELTVQQVGIK